MNREVQVKTICLPVKITSCLLAESDDYETKVNIALVMIVCFFTSLVTLMFLNLQLMNSACCDLNPI